MALPLAQPTALTKVFSKAVDGSNNPPDLGTLLIDDKTSKIYRWVTNLSALRTAGDVVAYDYANTNDTDVNQLGSGTTGLDSMAGVCMGAIPATTGIGLIQIWGNNASVLVAGNASNAIGASQKGVSGQVRVDFDVAIGTTPSFHNYFRIMVAYTTVSPALKQVKISCLNF